MRTRLWAAGVLASLAIWTYLKLRPATLPLSFEDPRRKYSRLGWLELSGLAAILFGYLAIQIPAILTGFQYDELFSAHHFVIGKSLAVSASTQIVFNNHFANSVEMNLIGRLLGTSEWAFRIPSLFWGLICVVLTWAIARLRRGRAAGLGTAALFAASPLFIFLSRQARGYSGLIAMTLISTYCFLLIIGGTRSFWVRACYTASIALGLYFHLYAVWALLTQLLFAGWLSWRGRNRPGLRELWDSGALGGVLGLLLYSPVFLNMCLMMGGRGRTPIRWQFPLELTTEVRGGMAVPLAIALAALAIVGAMRVRREETAYVFLWLGLPLCLVWLMLRPTDIYPRFFVYWMPALSYLIVCGALGFVDRLRTGATAKWMAAASCLVVAGGLTAWVVADLRMDCQDYRAGLTMERSITRRFVAGEDSDIFAYYLPGVRRIRFGELSRELADNSPMQVAYHDYYNGREDEAMAEKLSRVCDSRRRHWVVMFTCNSRSGTTGTEKPIGDVSLD